MRSLDDMQEATGAYKVIEEVLASQTYLIKVKTKLLPITVIKG
jgi:rtcB protein